MSESELRELDARIHREVMGQSVWYELNFIDGTNRLMDSCPCYSTDIAAAWQVVEKMQKNGWSYCIHSSDFHGESGASCYFQKEYRGGFLEPESGADSVPLAICRATLKALAATGTPT